jgi:hypothetical protein
MRSPGSWSRETRLLLLTMIVSAAVLGVLAQFRFPDVQRVEAPAQPLERLAARATFDELAGIIERLDRRIAPSIVVLRVGSRALPSPRSLRDLLSEPADPASPVRVHPVAARPPGRRHRAPRSRHVGAGGARRPAGGAARAGRQTRCAGWRS